MANKRGNCVDLLDINDEIFKDLIFNKLFDNAEYLKLLDAYFDMDLIIQGKEDRLLNFKYLYQNTSRGYILRWLALKFIFDYWDGKKDKFLDEYWLDKFNEINK